jgi:hypothetical protein
MGNLQPRWTKKKRIWDKIWVTDLEGGAMKKFEYKITKHPAQAFTQLVYFCTEEGQCNVEQLPFDQLKAVENLLNERGSEGWEMVQVLFGKDGVVVFWKRTI